MSKSILFVTDLNPQGSGYMSLSLPICDGLAKLGYLVRVIGLGNTGSEHQFPFSILPAQNLQEVLVMIQNLYNMHKYDVLIVALDIPLQEFIIQHVSKRPFKYIGIMPIEADPLVIEWAMVLQAMDKPFIISEFGANEAKKMGIDKAEHLVIGIDTAMWKIPTLEQINQARSTLNIKDEDFAVLTVADNQERKNLQAIAKTIALFKQDHPNVKWVLVTREYNAVGWKLRSLARRPMFPDTDRKWDITSNIMIFERGLDFIELWSIYSAMDVYINLSKAEGLGLGAIEAMAVGLPVIQTNCTAMIEVCDDDRGLLVPYEYVHTDPFGDGMRYWANPVEACKALEKVYDECPNTSKARKWVEGRTWKNTIMQIHNYLEMGGDKFGQAEAQTSE